MALKPKTAFGRISIIQSPRSCILGSERIPRLIINALGSKPVLDPCIFKNVFFLVVVVEKKKTRYHVCQSTEPPTICLSLRVISFLQWP